MILYVPVKNPGVVLENNTNLPVDMKNMIMTKLKQPKEEQTREIYGRSRKNEIQSIPTLKSTRNPYLEREHAKIKN